MRVKLSWIEGLVLVSIFGLLAGLMMPTGDHDTSPRYPPSAPRPATNLAAAAGEYYLGSGRGRNLRLSILADGRYSFVWWGCTGLHHREMGYVRETLGLYVLAPSGPSEPGIDRTFVLIGWGRRYYLIPPEKMAKFHDAIVEGGEPRYEPRGNFYIREPIEAAEGLPDRPENWAHELRENLLIGRVMEVSAVGLARIGRARIDLGADQGLCQGDLLTVQGRGNGSHRRLMITSVEARSCVADECSPGEFSQLMQSGQTVIAVRTSQESRR